MSKHTQTSLTHSNEKKFSKQIHSQRLQYAALPRVSFQRKHKVTSFWPGDYSKTLFSWRNSGFEYCDAVILHSPIHYDIDSQSSHCCFHGDVNINWPRQHIHFFYSPVWRVRTDLWLQYWTVFTQKNTSVIRDLLCRRLSPSKYKQSGLMPMALINQLVRTGSEFHSWFTARRVYNIPD